MPHDDDLFGVQYSSPTELAPGDLIDVLLMSVAAGPDGYVAVGRADEFSGTINKIGIPQRDVGGGMVWTSREGREWRRIPFDKAGLANPLKSALLWDVTGVALREAQSSSRWEAGPVS